MAMLKSALFSFIITGSGMMATSGCSSVMTHTGNNQGYYPGTRASLDILRDDDTSWAMMPLVALDLPFSAVADTLLLPYDYYRADSDKTTTRDRILQSEQQNQTASSQIATEPNNQL
ncbi:MULTISPECIES: YceK/YidQ family lipoprotein [unclassified Brenneria]|uniref:YceK/YidQ family lipoprotein n=1 Tax=unclassified Brenneria TaxID=2634434 RepID=UPI0029C4DB26|nr:MULTISPECIES: YceK/YidQ family lipoprotein [unclassified Brenneria]MDX5629344.1 YceK/YidQ family lipoprotein [Brenneria sp. L3-3Z]MDX5696493.1 YceK/YidQ family lipoprotein [Brenneria sp. L4-2C]MEE3663060.1 YceK/YidQ family lipoprotein [Brenneria sp. g21c3]